MKRTIPILLALALCGSVAVAQPDEVTQAIREAKGGITDYRELATLLAKLAWADGPGGTDDPRVAARARQELTQFGQRGMQAIYEAFAWADPEQAFDILLASREAHRASRSGLSPYVLPALDQALWFGSVDSKRLAMQVLREVPYGSFVLVVIDAGYEYPQLVPSAVLALEAIADPRARFFLAEVLDGDARNRELAARALTQTGPAAFAMLRDRVLDAPPEVRAASVRALLPASGVDDLTTLYEYAARYPGDEELIELIRTRAVELEALLEQLHDEDAAGSEPGS